jgi:hypothetical protein
MTTLTNLPLARRQWRNQRHVSGLWLRGYSKVGLLAGYQEARAGVASRACRYADGTRRQGYGARTCEPEARYGTRIGAARQNARRRFPFCGIRAF